MDLERCPKCGNAWQGGDKCRNCGFVPIGAGLDKLPKRKKKRVRKYVEPGSSRGLLITIFLGVSAYGTYAYQPWKDDWELVRSWFGQGRHHSVIGEWQIVKSVAVVKDKSLIAGRGIDKGTMKFSDKGRVDFDLQKGEEKTAASGLYSVQGILVAMNGVQTTASGAGGMPSNLNMSLHWTGPDALVAAYNGSEAIFLKRHPKGNPLAQLLQMGLKPGKSEGPGQIRGVIATMQKNVDDGNASTN